MPNNARNWNYNQIVKILKENGFALRNVRGSHHNYIGYIENSPRIVTIPFHGKKSIHPRTMSSIIEQSKISKSVWFKG
jgi:predicted RNA binding protein YcfA (HicA-like mRNA interferase family)